MVRLSPLAFFISLIALQLACRVLAQLTSNLEGFDMGSLGVFFPAFGL